MNKQKSTMLNLLDTIKDKYYENKNSDKPYMAEINLCIDLSSISNLNDVEDVSPEDKYQVYLTLGEIAPQDSVVQQFGEIYLKESAKEGYYWAQQELKRKRDKLIASGRGVVVDFPTNS